MRSIQLRDISLGDKRLDKRCNKLIGQFLKKPSLSIPNTLITWKDTKAAYRFFSNKKVDAEKIYEAAYEQTQKTIDSYDGILLVLQDTTDLDYTKHKKTKGLGYLETSYMRGMKVHSALASTEQGIPLGLLHQKRWIRKDGEYGKRQYRKKKDLKQKESVRWITTMQEVGKRVSKDRPTVLIGDRESDIYDLFAAERADNLELLVRANHNRRIEREQNKLFERIKHTKTAGRIKINVSKSTRHKPREAECIVKYTTLTIESPKGNGGIRLYCIQIEEERAVAGEKKISWTLLTTVPVESFTDAVRIAGWYVKRWLIERFHYCLKSGCKIEELQLQEKDRLEKALAIYSIVAWQILWITYEAREHPDDSCEKLFTKKEWHILARLNEKKIKGNNIPTISEAVRMMAMLGGFLGRKHDKDPGVKTLWRGLRKYSDIMEALPLLKDMGNG